MAAGDPQIVSFNVGGTLYATSKTTIMGCPDSMLAKMVQGGLPVLTDKAGNIFIDRDGAMFRYVLNYLRDGEFSLPASFTGYDQLLREVKFYQLGAQVEELVSTPAVVFKRPNGSRKVEEVAVIVKSTNNAELHIVATSLSDPPFAKSLCKHIDMCGVMGWRFADVQWPLVYASVIGRGFRPASGPPEFQTFVLEELSEEAPRVQHVVVIEKTANETDSYVATSLPSPSFTTALFPQFEMCGLKRWGFASVQWPWLYAGVIAEGFREVSSPPEFQLFIK